MSDPKVQRGRFQSGDVVWTPLRRKAILKHFRDDGKWDACYQSAHGGMTADKVTLAPNLLTPANDD